MSGLRSHLAGLSAEAAVERAYAAEGYAVAARRWRGTAGEIDLVLRGPDGLVFVEIKHSRSFAAAAARISPAQSARIASAACEFVAGEPGGQDTGMRFDAALVDGRGAIRIVPGALAV